MTPTTSSLFTTAISASRSASLSTEFGGVRKRSAFSMTAASAATGI
jgi:hypothetical protein